MWDGGSTLRVSRGHYWVWHRNHGKFGINTSTTMGGSISPWEYVIRSYLQFSTNMGAWMMPTISLRWGMQCFFWYHYGFSCYQPYTIGVWLVLKRVLYPKFKASLVANMMTWIMGFYGLWRIRGHFRVQLSWLTLYLRYYLRYPAQTQSLAG